MQVGGGAGVMVVDGEGREGGAGGDRRSGASPALGGRLGSVVTIPVFIFPVITIIMVILNPSVGPIKIQHFNFGERQPT